MEERDFKRFQDMIARADGLSLEDYDNVQKVKDLRFNGARGFNEKDIPRLIGYIPSVIKYMEKTPFHCPDCGKHIYLKEGWVQYFAEIIGDIPFWSVGIEAIQLNLAERFLRVFVEAAIEPDFKALIIKGLLSGIREMKMTGVAIDREEKRTFEERQIASYRHGKRLCKRYNLDLDLIDRAFAIYAKIDKHWDEDRARESKKENASEGF